MEVRAVFGRFVWCGVNIDNVTIHPSRGSIPHWRCANTTRSHMLHIHWPSEEWCRGRWKFGLEPWYAQCYTLCVNCWIANKEAQGPKRNFDARLSLSYGKNVCFSWYSLDQWLSTWRWRAPQRLWTICGRSPKIFYVPSCITFVLSAFRWGSLGYSSLLQWVTVKKELKTTGLDASVKTMSDAWTHSPQ